jgi:hypothetical protein
MSVAKMSIGKAGAGGANASYITRQKDCEKITFVNIAFPEQEGETGKMELQEARTNAIAYAHTREDVELAKAKQPNARTHYRLILTWDRKENSDKCSEMAERFLEKNFDKARAIIAVHQDTEHTHAHVWIDARQTDGKKINLRGNSFKTIDEKWAKQFDEEYATAYTPELKRKKSETAQWKKDVKAAKAAGVEPPPKPERTQDKFNYQYWQTKELTERAGLENEKSGAGENQRAIEPEAGRALDEQRQLERAKQTAAGTERASAPAIQGNAGMGDDREQGTRDNQRREREITQGFEETGRANDETYRSGERYELDGEEGALQRFDKYRLRDDEYRSVEYIAGENDASKFNQIELFENGYESYQGNAERGAGKIDSFEERIEFVGEIKFFEITDETTSLSGADFGIDAATGAMEDASISVEDSKLITATETTQTELDKLVSAIGEQGDIETDDKLPEIEIEAPQIEAPEIEVESRGLSIAM